MKTSLTASGIYPLLIIEFKRQLEVVKSIGFVIRLRMLEFKPCEWVTLGLGQVIQLLCALSGQHYKTGMIPCANYNVVRVNELIHVKHLPGS